MGEIKVEGEEEIRDRSVKRDRERKEPKKRGDAGREGGWRKWEEAGWEDGKRRGRGRIGSGGEGCGDS